MSVFGVPSPSTLHRDRTRLPVLGPKVESAVASPKSVRMSLTDRCDFACTYCRPSRTDGYATHRLDAAAWRTIVDGLIDAGVRRFRITGGEPLLVPQVLDVVRYIAARGVSDLALTTNASRLTKLAQPLRDAGLMRLNVSIDSLDAERFAAITRGGRLEIVLAGLEAAERAGFTSIKLNCVVLRGINDDEVEAITRFAWDKRMIPRFLEVMPIAEGAKLVGEHLVTARETRERIAHLLRDDIPEAELDRGPAKYVAARHDAGLKVGFITGTSDTFCASCDRLRVSSTGTLRPCLATEVGVDARAEAESGVSSTLVDKVREAWKLKPDGETWKGCTEDTAQHVSMRGIGG